MSEFEKLLAGMRAQRDIFRGKSKEAKQVFHRDEASILLQKVSLLTAWIDELESAIVRATLVELPDS